MHSSTQRKPDAESLSGKWNIGTSFPDARQYLNSGLNMTETCSEVHRTCFTAPHNCSCWTRTSLPLLCGPPVVCLWPSQPPQGASIGSRVQRKSPTWRKFGTIKRFAFLIFFGLNELKRKLKGLYVNLGSAPSDLCQRSCQSISNQSTWWMNSDTGWWT